MAVFLAFSLVLLLLALAVVVLPLLRSPLARQRARLNKALSQGLLTPEEFAQKYQAAETASRHQQTPKALMAIVLLLMPALAWLVYQQVGTPAALQITNPQPRAGGSGDELGDHAAAAWRNPESATAWMRLATSYMQARRYQEAVPAWQRALGLLPEDDTLRADVLTSLAESQLFSAAGVVPAAAVRNINASLDINPSHPRALWLAGAVAYQQQDYRSAVRHWQTLLPLVGDQSVAGSIRQQLDRALEALHGQSGLDLESETAIGSASADTPAPPATGFEPVINADIRFGEALQQALADRVNETPVLFVFARRQAGGPPLAIRRIDDPEPPVTVRLDNSLAMVAGNDLASVGPGNEIEITARLSWSGSATAQPGDWQASAPVTLGNQATTVALTLDTRLQ